MEGNDYSSEKYLKLVSGKTVIPLAFVSSGGKIFLMSSGNSRWPSDILRGRRANLQVGRTEILGSAELVSDSDLKKEIRKLFSSKYGEEQCSRWFDSNSRVITVSCNYLPESGSGQEYYFTWLREEFESISGDYDRHIYGNRINTYLRERSVETMQKLFPAGSNLLEIGCGTGTETISMLKAGYSVTALDIAKGMIESLKSKAEKEGLSSRLATEVMAASECSLLLDRYGKGSFDGVYSTYGALNCEPDITGIPAALSQLMKSNSVLFLGIFNRFCLWEMFAHTVGLKPGRIFERLGNPIREGSSRFCIDVYAYSTMEIRRIFSSNFTFEGMEAVPLVIPPSNYVKQLEKFSENPGRLERLDRKLSGIPVLRNFGDHFLMWFRKL